MSTYNATGLVYDQSNLTFDGNVAGLSNMPVVGVFVAFDDGPYVADPDWVEVTDYVRDVNIRRGRQDDLQQFPSGSCSITFDNRDRLFDPFNTAGAYYGKLKPRRQVRVVGQWNGVNYPLFRGFVAGWPVEFTEGGKDSTVTVDCFDLIGLLATDNFGATTFGSNPVEEITKYTLSLGPSNYYKMDEGQNATRFANQMSTTKFVTTASQIGSAGQIVPASLAQGVYADGFQSNDTFSRPLNAVSMSFWIASQLRDQRVTYDRFLPRLQVRFTTGTSFITATYSGTQYSVDILLSSTSWQLDRPNHFVITFNPSGNTFTCYVNGKAAGLTGVTSSALLYIASYEMYSSNCGIQEWSSYDRVLTADEALQLYNFGSAQVIEQSSARINRLFSNSPIESSSVNVETGVALVTDLVANERRIQMVNDAWQSENGDFFADRSGVLQFVSRYGWSSRSRSNTSQATFTDTGTGVFYDAESVRMSLDADRMRNDTQVTFTGNGVVTSTDEVSVQEYGAASEQVSTVLPDAASAQTLADYRVSIYKNPKLRVEPFLVKGQRNPSYDWPRLLNLELLDRFTFVRTPSVGSAIQRDMLLQSIEHRITPGTWETTINGSARYTGWFILGVSLLGSTEDVLL